MTANLLYPDVEREEYHVESFAANRVWCEPGKGKRGKITRESCAEPLWVVSNTELPPLPGN